MPQQHKVDSKGRKLKYIGNYYDAELAEVFQMIAIMKHETVSTILERYMKHYIAINKTNVKSKVKNFFAERKDNKFNEE